MLEILLFLVLLTLLFGSGWLTGLLRNVALFAALFVAVWFVSRLGIPLDYAVYGVLGLLFIFGVLATKWLDGADDERKALIRAKKNMERAERYKAEQEVVAAQKES